MPAGDLRRLASAVVAVSASEDTTSGTPATVAVATLDSPDMTTSFLFGLIEC